MKKSKGVAILLAVLLVLAGLSYYASIILSSTGKGEDKNINLVGLGRWCQHHISGRI